MQLVAWATAAAAAFAGLASAAPAYSIPSGDGFPNPNSQQLDRINKQADGTLPLNNPPAPPLNKSSIPTFQLIAFNENFEVAFFSSLIQNITSGQHDNEFRSGEHKNELVSILKTVLAQEELHAINAANALKANNAFVPAPCTYKFPTTGVHDAITLAETFTSLVLGTLQDASQGLAKNGDNGPVRAVASVIGQEGEQNGFYRNLLGRKPSQKPFLTTSIAPFAFSALQQFIVECPYSLDNVGKIPIFPPLVVKTGKGGADVEPRDQTITFSADLSGYAPAKSYYGKCDGLFITYFTGQDAPNSNPISNCHWSGKDNAEVTFEANFPFNELVMEGLSIASLTYQKDFPNPDAVAAATLAAPGLIQVNDRI